MTTPLPVTQQGANSNGAAQGLINGRFRPTKRLGSGSFGEIYMGVGPGNEKVAIKFEKSGLRCPQLRHEYKVYRELAGCQGIGRVQYYGIYGNNNVMVMDLLGQSLEDLFTKCGRRFSLKTTLKLADQMLQRVEAVHGRHLIHRDIKPANFVMGSDTSETVFCIDFGLSKRYRNPHTLAHIPHRVGKSLTGTPRYASINNHLGIEQARRDDLEAIGYVLIYFLKGRLPWQGLKARNASRKYKMIMEKKQSTSIASLCAGCPAAFSEYLSFCRSLKFEADPNIKYLRGLFHELYQKQGYDLATLGDNDWDWNRKDNPQAALGPPGGADEEQDGRDNAPSREGSGPGYSTGTGARMGMGGSRGGATSGAMGGSHTGTRPGTAERPQTAITNAAHLGGSLAGGNAGDGDDAAGDRNFDDEGGMGAEAGAGDYHNQVQSSRSRPETSGSAGLTNGSAPPGRAWSESVNRNRPSTAGGEAVVRRPQSAHGARSSPKTATYNSGGAAAAQDGYVVAGAKSMMTYRRSNRDGSGSSGVAGQRPASGGGNGTMGSGSRQEAHEMGNPAWGRTKPSVRPKSAGAGVVSSTRVSSKPGSSGGSGGGSAGNARNGGQRSGSLTRGSYYMAQNTVRSNTSGSSNLYSRNSKTNAQVPAGNAKPKAVRSPWSARVLHTHTSSVG